MHALAPVGARDLALSGTPSRQHRTRNGGVTAAPRIIIFQHLRLTAAKTDRARHGVEARELPGVNAQMQGSFCRFYVHEDHRHHGRLVWEWLLEQGNALGMRGGSAFRAMAGFGRHHALHEARFFELAGSLTIEVEFLASSEEVQRLLDLLHREKVRLFYAYTPAFFGVINPDASDPPTVGEC